MESFDNTRIDSAATAELSAVTYNDVLIDAGASVTINGSPLTSVGSPTLFNIRVTSVSSPSGNVYLIGTTIEADVTPLTPPVVITYYYDIDYIDEGYFVTETS